MAFLQNAEGTALAPFESRTQFLILAVAGFDGLHADVVRQRELDGGMPEWLRCFLFLRGIKTMFLFGPLRSRRARNSKALLLTARPPRRVERAQQNARRAATSTYLAWCPVRRARTPQGYTGNLTKVVNFLLRNKHINQAST